MSGSDQPSVALSWLRILLQALVGLVALFPPIIAFAILQHRLKETVQPESIGLWIKDCHETTK